MGKKSLLAISSTRDPRRDFPIMKTRPIGLAGAHENPHGVHDKAAGKWRLLVCEHGKTFRAGMWESDYRDRGFTPLAGPVKMDSNGTMIQTFWRQTLRPLRQRRPQDLHPDLSGPPARRRTQGGNAAVERPGRHPHLAQCHSPARRPPRALHRPDDGSRELPRHAQAELDLQRALPLPRPLVRAVIHLAPSHRENGS